MKSNHKIFSILFILAVLLIAGCNSNQDNNVVETTSPIKVGFMAPLSGEATSYGQNSIAGAQLAVNEFNAKGGVNGRKIELIAEDDKCSAEGVNAIQKLINLNDVTGIIGPACSGSGGPALPIAQAAGVPTVIISASAPHLAKIGDYIFRIYPSDAFQGKYAAEFMYNTLGKKKVAIVYVQNDWGQGIKEVFIKRFEELGGEVVLDAGVAQDARDFKTEITKMKTNGAEIAYIPLYPASGIAAVKQMKELNVNIPIFGGDSFAGDEFIKSEYTDGVIYSVAVVNTPEDFKARVRSVSGFENLNPNLFASLGYDAANVLLNGIKRAGTDKVAIKNVLQQTSMQGVSTELIEFDQDGDLKKAEYEVKVVKNKEAVNY